MTDVFILAQGEAKRLEHLKQPKQFLEVNGERIVDRTVRLARHFGARSVTLVAVNDEPWTSWSRQARVPIHTLPEKGRTLAQTVWRYMDVWGKDAALLLGDVVFSRWALSRVLSHHDGFSILFRRNPNPFTVKAWKEVFAYRLGPSAADVLGRKCGEWDRNNVFYDSFTILDIVCGGRGLEADDWTDDVDTPQDVLNLPKLGLLVADEERLAVTA